MQIRCIKDKIETSSCLNEDNNFYVEIGKDYFVQAIQRYNNLLYFSIYEENDETYPMWHDSELFEIIDATPSKYWKSSFGKLASEKIDNGTMIGFSEWVDNPIIYEKLLDDDEVALLLFYKYKKLIEKENILLFCSEFYQNPNIKEVGINLGDNWIMCPNCGEAYEIIKEKGTIECINLACKLKFNNPCAKEFIRKNKGQKVDSFFKIREI